MEAFQKLRRLLNNLLLFWITQTLLFVEMEKNITAAALWKKDFFSCFLDERLIDLYDT